MQDRVEQAAVAPIGPATWHKAEVRAAHLGDLLGGQRRITRVIRRRTVGAQGAEQDLAQFASAEHIVARDGGLAGE